MSFFPKLEYFLKYGVTKVWNLLKHIICFGFKKTNREISTAGGEVIFSIWIRFI